jgi:DNA polymerase III epsilon subunit-like protein
MTHIMVDLETLGTKPGCAIASVGACKFTLDGVSDTFYRIVNVGAGANQHPTWPALDARTVEWWMGQPDEARKIFTDTSARRHIVEVLHDFKEWCGSDRVLLWGHGAAFDGPILEAAYDALWPGNCPWKFYDLRDTRTLYALADVAPDRTAGTHHNALDDAKLGKPL